MRAVARSVLVPRHPWLLGACAILCLTACATTPSAEEGTPALTDPVDIGYGSVERDHVIGSVNTVEPEEGGAGDARTFAEMLMRIPGVRVLRQGNGDLSVQIRGINSFQGGQDPLFVIDGQAIGHTARLLTGINPSTIESITVLKDAGSTAVYGSRGANGVILIRTKRGGG